MVRGERAIGGYDLAGGTLAFVATSPTELPELFTVIDGTERRLTSLGATVPSLPPGAATRAVHGFVARRRRH